LGDIPRCLLYESTYVCLEQRPVEPTLETQFEFTSGRENTI